MISAGDYLSMTSGHDLSSTAPSSSASSSAVASSSSSELLPSNGHSSSMAATMMSSMLSSGPPSMEMICVKAEDEEDELENQMRQLHNSHYRSSIPSSGSNFGSLSSNSMRDAPTSGPMPSQTHLKPETGQLKEGFKEEDPLSTATTTTATTTTTTTSSTTVKTTRVVHETSNPEELATWLRCFKEYILRPILKNPKSQPFRKPVDAVALGIYPVYFQVIKQPMDLGTIRKRVDGRKYTSKQRVIDDLMLVWMNALTFNPPMHYVYNAALEFKKFSEARVDRLLRLGVAVLSMTRKNHGKKSSGFGRASLGLPEKKHRMPRAYYHPDKVPYRAPRQQQHHQQHHFYQQTIASTQSAALSSSSSAASGVSKGLTACDNLLKDLLALRNQCDFVEPFMNAVTLADGQLTLSLTRIEQKLRSQSYRHYDEFASDMRQMFTDTYKYNYPDSPMVTAAGKLQKEFEVRFAKINFQELMKQPIRPSLLPTSLTEEEQFSAKLRSAQNFMRKIEAELKELIRDYHRMKNRRKRKLLQQQRNGMAETGAQINAACVDVVGAFAASPTMANAAPTAGSDTSGGAQTYYPPPPTPFNQPFQSHHYPHHHQQQQQQQQHQLLPHNNQHHQQQQQQQQFQPTSTAGNPHQYPPQQQQQQQQHPPPSYPYHHQPQQQQQQYNYNQQQQHQMQQQQQQQPQFTPVPKKPRLDMPPVLTIQEANDLKEQISQLHPDQQLQILEILQNNGEELYPDEHGEVEIEIAKCCLGSVKQVRAFLENIKAQMKINDEATVTSTVNPMSDMRPTTVMTSSAGTPAARADGGSHAPHVGNQNRGSSSDSDSSSGSSSDSSGSSSDSD